MQTYLEFIANDGQKLQLAPIEVETIGVVDEQIHIKTVHDPPKMYMTDEITSVTKMRELKETDFD